MVYAFDPMYWDGTIFSLDDTSVMSGDWDEYMRANEPIPASCFPKSLNFVGAKSNLPDMFHTSRSFNVFSEPARAVTEQCAAGQVEFIPVAVHAPPEIAGVLKFASAYYFINVLGRAQRLQWLDMPTRKFPRREDGTVPFTMLPERRDWKLRERAAGEPLIWRDMPWRSGDRDYRGHSVIFIEDVVWRELDANFPDQLNVQWVG
jgi:hypothetical protein